MNDDAIASANALAAQDTNAYLATAPHQDMLRFITCGAVDDGKSTLIGRLLYDSKNVLEDQRRTLEADSARAGTQGGALDFALLMDGLASEREQGITIDVAYRFFSTEKRAFIVADTPGHVQYTRNMITGASNADLAVILVDATKGILTQTRRHSYLVHLLGIKHIILAVNKMDLINYDQTIFDQITTEYQSFAQNIGLADVVAIPLSGLRGENITHSSQHIPWYQGPSLLAQLEATPPTHHKNQEGAFCLPVQWVNRPNPQFRGFAGMIESGTIRPKDAIRILPSGQTTTIARIVGDGADYERAIAGQSVMLTLTDELDCARGDIMVAAHAPLEVANQFETTLIWMSDQEMIPGRAYWLKIGTQTVSATLHPPKYEINVNNQEHISSKTLSCNAIGVANITLDRPLPFAPYAENPGLGSFILIDKHSHQTLAAGMIHFALRRAHNIHWQATDVTSAQRAAHKKQRPAVLWFTGLSGAGKSAIANCLERKLAAMDKHTFLLDGDNIRHGLNKDLGFTEADRIENIRRVGEVARLMADAGLIVLTAFISPFRPERAMVRAMMAPDEFYEIYVDTPLKIAEERDVKGLYAKARAGKLRNFTGIDSPYEPPENPDIYIDTTQHSVESATDLIIAHLTEAQRL